MVAPDDTELARRALRGPCSCGAIGLCCSRRAPCKCGTIGLCCARRELEAVLTIQVQDGAGQQYDVRVLTALRPREKLCIELNQTNMDLLQLDPSADSAASEAEPMWAPVVNERNVHWNAARMHVYSRIPNGDGKTTYISKKVNTNQGTVEIQAQVDQLAQELQAQFEAGRLRRAAAKEEVAV